MGTNPGAAGILDRFRSDRIVGAIRTSWADAGAQGLLAGGGILA